MGGAEECGVEGEGVRYGDGKYGATLDGARQSNASALAIALGLGSIALAVVQVFFGVAVSFTGRWGWVNIWMVQLLGQHGPAIFSAGTGVLLLVIGICGRKAIRRN